MLLLNNEKRTGMCKNKIFNLIGLNACILYKQNINSIDFMKAFDSVDINNTYIPIQIKKMNLASNNSNIRDLLNLTKTNIFVKNSDNILLSFKTKQNWGSILNNTIDKV